MEELITGALAMVACRINIENNIIYIYCISPNSVVILGVFTVVFKGRCLIKVSRVCVRLIYCYL